MEAFCSPRERIGKSTTIACNRANSSLDDADVYIVVGNHCTSGATLCYVDRMYLRRSEEEKYRKYT